MSRRAQGVLGIAVGAAAVLFGVLLLLQPHADSSDTYKRPLLIVGGVAMIVGGALQLRRRRA